MSLEVINRKVEQIQSHIFDILVGESREAIESICSDSFSCFGLLAQCFSQMSKFLLFDIFFVGHF